MTEYCLGYKPAIALREDIVNTLEALGIGVDNFPSSLETIPFNVNLLVHVKTYLSTVRGLQTKPLPSVPTGSVAQLIVTSPSGPLNLGTFVQRSYDQVPIAIGVASEAFTYNISRRLEDMPNDQLRRVYPTRWAANPPIRLHNEFRRFSENTSAQMFVVNYHTTRFNQVQTLEPIAQRSIKI